MESDGVEITPILREDTRATNEDVDALSENTPLLGSVHGRICDIAIEPYEERTWLFNFLEAKTGAGSAYETFTILLIFLSVISFVASSLFLKEYHPGPLAEMCDKFCDALLFGNYTDNALSGLGIGATSFLEIFTVGVFTLDYIFRFYTADLIDAKYKGFKGRVRFVFSFFSLVDLASTVPFYVDAFLLPNTDLAASNFLRMFRLLRMMRVEGRYDLALGLLDDVIYEQRGILATALFVGATVWGVMSSFFYLAERKNPDMIYCGAAPSSCFDSIDTSLCVTDEWGFVDCSAAGCENIDGKEACWNVYRSIADASFWTLMELFGEFPLVDQHSAYGKVLGTFTAVFACAVFALPAGIFGSGFEEQISRRKKRNSEEQSDGMGSIHNDSSQTDEHVESGWELIEVVGDEGTFRGRVYNFIHLQTTGNSKLFDAFISTLVIGTSLTFMFDTVTASFVTPSVHMAFDVFELGSVIVFTIEYVLRIYSVAEDPRYKDLSGRFTYSTRFLPLVDFLSVAPYWINIAFANDLLNSSADESIMAAFVNFLRLLRLLRFEKYTKAFTIFDDVIRDNFDVLGVTAFSSLLLWILFSAILYYTERDNPNGDIANYYKSIPHAMWITLLNLSGECPLAHYTLAGKIMMGVIGLFATAIFGVPIGLLGAGFEEMVANEYDDSPDETDSRGHTDTSTLGTHGFQSSCYRFVNGIGSLAATVFELLIYAFIMLTVTVGIIQTLPERSDSFHQVEWIAVVLFTFEYLVRFIGAGADPEFAHPGKSGVRSRISFVFSFYSIIDLAAILPFYIAYAMPGSWVDAHDEYFRMLRLLRLLKLDKYFPSISLVDDVLRLKRNVLAVSCFAAATLWVLFAGLMYVAEFKDHSMEIDNLPLYGCVENCTMSDRYDNFFKSFPLTGIHLTGDFPMVEYDGAGRIVCFFMIIAAVGVVSIPSGIIASGFAEIVQSKAKARRGEQVGNVGDDWFDIRYRELEGQPAPRSMFGPFVDSLQENVHAYLEGKMNETTGMVERTTFSQLGRLAFLSLIIANVIAVVIESIPEADKYVGNQKGNAFDVFEVISVAFFTIEYALRLFSARKSRSALYSPFIYATTFFGLVDLLSIAPWYIQCYLSMTDEAKIFRIVRIFRVLQLEDFIVAFSKLDNVLRASKSVLKATGLMAIIIWIGSSALFFLFEQNNPNFRTCDATVPLVGTQENPGCYDFESTVACNQVYEGMCSQAAFTNMPNTMFYVAVFLGGDWGFVDFTWQGKIVCMFLCVAGIALYAIPIGTLFDSFGAVLGLGGDDDEEDEENTND